MPQDLLNNPTGMPDQWSQNGWQPAPSWTPNEPGATPPAGNPPVDPKANPNPSDQNGNGIPNDQGGKPGDQKPDYSALVNNVGQDAINTMIQQYDQVVAILEDPEQIKNLSKEQVMQMYQARDQLQDKLSSILPVLEQWRHAKMEESVKDIENQAIKDYIMGFKDEFDDPEDFNALVEFTKGLMSLLWNGQVPQPNGGQPSNPADMKNVMWGNQTPGPDFDVSKALLSTDPEERAKAKQFMDWMFNQMEGKK